MVHDDAGRQAVQTRLTPAESRLLQQLPTHKTLIRIAADLCVAHSTAKTQSLAIYRKLGVADRGAAVRAAVELGWIDDPWPTMPDWRAS